jgi:hypothetical protein
MDFEPALGRLMSPVLNDVEVAIVDVEVPSVQVEDGSPYMTWPHSKGRNTRPGQPSSSSGRGSIFPR